MGKLASIFALVAAISVLVACGGGDNASGIDEPPPATATPVPTPKPLPTPTPRPTATPTPTPTPRPAPTATPDPAFLDSEPPEAVIEAPERRDVVPGPDIATSGTASDNVGIVLVDVAVRNRDTDTWLRRDGTLGNRQFWEAELSDPGATTTSWSMPFTLEAGNWSLMVRPEDAEGNRPETAPTLPFEVFIPTGDDVLPVAVIDLPTRREVVIGPEVTFSGTATDDVGVIAVGVGVRDRDSDLWVRRDGTFGERQFWEAELSDPGSTSTSWSLPMTLGAGNWSVMVRAEDANRNRDEEPPTTPFEVEVESDDETAPTAVVAAPARNEILESTNIVLAGTATDDVGVTGVDVAVRNRDTDLWVRRDGTFGERQFWEAELSAPDAVSTNWSLPITLDEGNWSVMVRAEDANGNREDDLPTSPFAIEFASDDSLAPETFIFVPDDNGVLDGPGIVISGSASDNAGVGLVEVAIRDRDNRGWLRRDGTLGDRQFWETELARPGDVSTEWSLPLTLSAGNWAITVRAEDTSGNRDETPAMVSFAIRI